MDKQKIFAELDELWFLNYPKETGLGKGILEQKNLVMNMLIKSFLSDKLDQALAEERERVVEKWDKYVDAINEDAHYVIHNPVREGFMLVLASPQGKDTNTKG